MEKKIDYRKKFETATAAAKPSAALLKLLEGEKAKMAEKPYAPKRQGDSAYGSFLVGDEGYLSVSMQGCDQKGTFTAFILEAHYSVSGAGVRESVDFGAIDEKTGQVFRYGWHVVRGATAKESDDLARQYNEVRIIEEKGGAVIAGFSSGKRIDIYKIDAKKGSCSLIESHDLEAEKREAKKAKLRRESEKEQDFGKRLETIGKMLEGGIELAYDPVIVELEKGRLGIIAIPTASCRYDPGLGQIYFYAVKDDGAEPKLIRAFRPSYYSEGKFFSDRVKVSIGKEGGKLVAKMRYSTGTAQFGGYSTSYGPKEESVELKI